MWNSAEIGGRQMVGMDVRVSLCQVIRDIDQWPSVRKAN
jgi:hypothetical protein